MIPQKSQSEKQQEVLYSLFFIIICMLLMTIYIF